MSTNNRRILVRHSELRTKIFEDSETHEYIVEVYFGDDNEKVVLSGKDASEYLSMTCMYLDGLQK